MSDKYVSIPQENGSINISEEVVASLVVNAINETEGVSGLANTAGNELAELIGLKTVQKGIKVQFNEGKITVDAIITVQYGQNIVKVAQDAQDAVNSAILSATGIEDSEVNIHVSGIAFK
jgi:uncharacterized alkaline shock family protein YloU